MLGSYQVLMSEGNLLRPLLTWSNSKFEPCNVYVLLFVKEASHAGCTVSKVMARSVSSSQQVPLSRKEM